MEVQDSHLSKTLIVQSRLETSDYDGTSPSWWDSNQLPLSEPESSCAGSDLIRWVLKVQTDIYGPPISDKIPCCEAPKEAHAQELRAASRPESWPGRRSGNKKAGLTVTQLHRNEFCPQAVSEPEEASNLRWEAAAPDTSPQLGNLGRGPGCTQCWDFLSQRLRGDQWVMLKAATFVAICYTNRKLSKGNTGSCVQVPFVMITDVVL